MLIIWIQDVIQKKIPLCEFAIRNQALNFYNYFKKNSAINSKDTLVESGGWFKKCH